MGERDTGDAGDTGDAAAEAGKPGDREPNQKQDGQPIIPPPRDDGPRDSQDAGGTDPGPAPEMAPVHLAFEDITLDGAPQAVTDFAFIPGRDDELLLLEKAGRILHYRLDGDGTRLLGAIRLDHVFDGQDCALVSLAFDPDFDQNRYVYFAYCDDKDYSTVSRHELDPEDLGRINRTRAPILRVGEDDAPKPWHNAGAIGFDGDGNLWALFGEKDDGPQAQALDNLMGAVVRVRPRRGVDEQGYETPGDNPFFGMDTAREEMVAYGLRSPWRGTLDRHGRLFIGDVGGDFEELNLLSDWAGVDFGWPDENGPCGGKCTGTESLVSWDNDLENWAALEDVDAEPSKRRSIWVGTEYRSADVDPYGGRLDGKVLYGDFCGGWVRAIAVDGLGLVRSDAHVGHLAQVTSMRQGPDGHLYALVYGNCFTKPYGPGALKRAVLDE